MEITRGTRETEPDGEPSTSLAEHTFSILGVVSLTIAAMGCAFEYLTRFEVTKGVYSILAAMIVIGGAGWTICWAVRGEGRRVRRDMVAESQETRDELARVKAELAETNHRLAELTSALEQLSTRNSLRSGPASPCRATGHMYASQASEATPAGVRQASVDAATDPAGVSLQRAREDGIEEGFDIGYRAQLAELGVPSLPMPRRRPTHG